MLKLALIQMRVEPGAKKANLQRVSRLVGEAVGQGAQLALLPEAMTVGWTDSRSGELADEIPGGESCVRLGQLARQYGIFLCAGIVERAGDKVFNSAVLIDPSGNVILHHRKIYELEIAHDCYALGDRLNVVDTPFGRIGLMICADAFAPGQIISRTLGLMGAKLILSPCAWAVPAEHDNAKEPYGQLWRDNYGPVARDFKLWIAGVSNVGPITTGPWAGRNCIGSSLLIGPDGRGVLQGPYGIEAEKIIYSEIQLPPRLRRGTGWVKA